MANPRGTALNAWSESDVETLERMLGEDSPHIDIARKLRRTLDAVESKIRSMKEAKVLGDAPAPGLSRYEVPDAISNDDAKHLALIAKAPGKHQSFPVAFSRAHYRVTA